MFWVNIGCLLLVRFLMIDRYCWLLVVGVVGKVLNSVVVIRFDIFD